MNLYHFLASWLHRNCDAVVFWGVVLMVAVSVGGGWAQP